VICTANGVATIHPRSACSGAVAATDKARGPARELAGGIGRREARCATEPAHRRYRPASRACRLRVGVPAKWRPAEAPGRSTLRPPRIPLRTPAVAAPDRGRRNGPPGAGCASASRRSGRSPMSLGSRRLGNLTPAASRPRADHGCGCSRSTPSEFAAPSARGCAWYYLHEPTMKVEIKRCFY
jgi:hypothetical protein